MSSRELRNAAVHATCIDRRFDSDVVRPVQVKSFSCSTNVATQGIVPGGQWILLMFEDGSINLYELSGSASPLLTLARPDDGLHRTLHIERMSISFSSAPLGGELLVLVSESYVKPSGDWFARCLVYHLDVHVPFLRLLATVVKPDQYSNFILKDGLLVSGWEENGSYLLDIRKITVSPCEDEQEALLNLGSIMAGLKPMITMLCPRRFLVSVAQHITIYAIPELKFIRGGMPSQVIDITPLAICGEPHTDSDRSIQNYLCSHHAGNRLSTVAKSANGGFDIIVLRSVGQPTDKLVRHATEVYDFSPSRAIWYNVDEPGEIELWSCTIFTHVNAHVGYMRLGRSKSPDPSRLSSIPIAIQVGHIQDVAWDQQSGLICILVSFYHAAMDSITTLITAKLV